MVQGNMIKGRIAETIVRCLFEDLGFEVIPYGYENTCPTLVNRDKLIVGDVRNHIRKAPDFIVVDKEDNANFVEVKFRADGNYKRDADYPFRDCYIILLTKEYIGIEQYKNLYDEASLTGLNFMAPTMGTFGSLPDSPIFKECDLNVVRDYRKLLIKYMGDEV